MVGQGQAYGYMIIGVVILVIGMGYQIFLDGIRNDTNPDEVANKIHFLTNEERKENGLQPLDFDYRIADIAKAHSQDMATRDYYKHTTPDGITSEIRLGMCHNSLGDSFGENIHLIHPDFWENGDQLAKVAVNDWMNSTGHRENILEKEFHREGIGISIKNGNAYLTQDFCS